MIEIQRILTPVDFSNESQHALAYAVSTARWYGARITALHVFVNRPAVNIIPPLYPAGVAPVQFESIRDDLISQLQKFVQPFRAPDVAIDVAVEEGPDAHREILAQAGVLAADLIVIGTHGGGGMERLMLGSTAEKLLRKATMCPVIVVPPRAPDVSPLEPVHFRQILCPVDFSEGSIAALPYAMSLAEEADAHLTLLNAIEPPELYGGPKSGAVDLAAIRTAIEADRIRRLQELVPDSVREFCTVHTAVVEGRPSRAILQMAEQRHADLIVMGLHGRGLFDLMLFGSNTHHVVRAAACPVLTVRAGVASA